MSVSFYDLGLKFHNEKHAPTPARSLALNDIANQTEYTYLALSYSIPSDSQPAPPPIEAFRRLNVKKHFKQVLPNIAWLSEFDLVAAAPQTDNDFQYCCVEGDCDLITLKLHERLNLMLTPQVVMQAVDRGVMFEVVYAPADYSPSTRTLFVNNAAKLIRATRGQSIVISSGCKELKDQRAPWDALNMGCVLGLSVEQAQAALSMNPEHALRHAKARQTFKSVMTPQESG